MTGKKGFILCMLLSIIFVVILVFINRVINKNPNIIVNKLSTVSVDNEKIKLNNIIKDINLDFSIAGTSHPDDEHTDMFYINSIDEVKVKSGNIWYLANEKNNIITSLIGVNKNNDDIFVKDGKISIIMLNIDEDNKKNEKSKVKIYDDLILGKSTFSKVMKKVKKIESDNVLVDVGSMGISLEIFNGKTKEESEKYIFAEFKFDDSMILNKFTVQDNKTVSTS